MKMGVHADSLAESLSGADLVFVYRPRDMDPRFDDSLKPLGDRLRVSNDYDELVASMERRLQQGDQVVFMSNGGFGASRQKLTMALQKKRAPLA